MTKSRRGQIEDACSKYDPGEFSTAIGRLKISFFTKGAEWADANPLMWPEDAGTILRTRINDLGSKVAIAVDALDKCGLLLKQRDEQLAIAVGALKEISKDIYELNPWTVCESNTAKIANEAIAKIKELGIIE